tara:strand:- start:2177 stop:2593 length:417 start_codon:yes stop_codon:yes gene_type:complete
MNLSNHTLAENTMFRFRPLLRQTTFVETSHHQLSDLLPKKNNYLSNSWSIGNMGDDDDDDDDSTLPSIAGNSTWTVNLGDLSKTIKKKHPVKPIQQEKSTNKIIPTLFHNKPIYEIVEDLKKKAHSSNTYTFKTRYNV